MSGIYIGVGVSTTETLYRTVRLIRRFEELVVEFVNSNEIAGVTHEYIGEEAIAAGVCAALREDDYITSTHRGHGHVLAKGADAGLMMAELFGRTTGLNRGRGGSMHIADVSLGVLGANGIVAAGAPFAAGAAWSSREQGFDRVAVAFFGDGGINQGVLHETMNLAAIWKLGVIFVCENNRYALTLPAERATAGAIHERVAAYGIPSQVVDGMDASAVYEATAEAVERARAGGGPSFLLCEAYRFSGHHTAEGTMGLTYRTDEEIERWRARDPVELAGARLDPERRAEIDAEVEERLAAAVDVASTGPHPEPEQATDFMYATGTRPRGVVEVVE
jgi:TPP-dependent pyruvate/acetoin dehydrogenase alpha subunit